MWNDYQEYKQSAKSFNIHINDDNRDIADSIFIDVVIVLKKNNIPVCAFPLNPNDNRFQENYMRAFTQFCEKNDYTMQKLGMYRLQGSNQYFVVKSSYRSKYALPQRILKLSKGIQHNNNGHKVQLDIFFEDLSDTTNIGSYIIQDNAFCFSPIIVFNYDLFKQSDIYTFSVQVASFIGDGEFTSGNWNFNTNSKYRTLKVIDFPKYATWDRSIQTMIFLHDKKIISKKSNLSLNRNEAYFINTYSIRKSLLLGDVIDFDWFGQEEGFVIFDENGRQYRLYPNNISNVGEVHPFKDFSN